MKKIMILGASILQLPAIQKAKEMGLDVIAVDMNPEAVGFQVKDIRKEIISTIDIPEVMQAAKRHKINGIMTLASDMPMRTVAAVAEEMNLVGIDYDTAIKATNKAEMRIALRKNNVPIPMFFRVKTKEEFNQAVQAIKNSGYRCIVKPADNSGSRGIDLLDNYELETMNRAYEYGKHSSRSGDLMVEEFMEGPEVSVETLSISGRCHVIQITDKLTTGAPYFVEMGHSQPSQLSEEIKKQICKIAIDANRAIGIKDGPSHTEIKVTKDGPKIVELGARLGGDNITTHLTPLSTGVDMVKCCIEIALGQTPDLQVKKNRGSAIRYFQQHAGIVEKIEGINKAKNIQGVVQISIVHGVGEKITDIKDSGSRMGFIIAQNESAKIAIQSCEKAYECLEVKIR